MKISVIIQDYVDHVKLLDVNAIKYEKRKSV